MAIALLLILGWALCQFKCAVGLNACTVCNNTECVHCQPGYYLANFACSPCTPTCATCLDSNSCKQCLAGYINSGKTCFPCEKALLGCGVCISFQSCMICQLGTILQPSTGFCNACPNGCLSCSYNLLNAVICQSCAQGFFFQSQNCQPCTNNCLVCNFTMRFNCLRCNVGYYLNFSTITCSACLENCLKCVGSGDCQQCGSGYFFNDKICAKCDASCLYCVNSATQCILCNPGYVFQSINCIPCLQNCYFCSTFSCYMCEQLYYLDLNLSCQKCNNACLFCTGPTVNECSACAIGFYYDQPNRCAACNVENCLACPKLDSCYQCKPNFNIIPGTPDSCRACIQGFDCAALYCNVGFYLGNGVCVACSTLSPQCQICTRTCLQCKITTYLDADPSVGCVACPKGCLLCTELTVCLFCSSNYFLGQELACIQCFVKNCYSCVSNNHLCDICNTKYFIENNQCVLCSNGCFTCQSRFICTSCTVGTYPLERTCHACLGACTACQSQNNCLSCSGAFFLNEVTNLCVACRKNCLLCDNLVTCYQCEAGNFVTFGVCVVCPTECKVCISTNSCLLCSLKYEYSSNACTRCAVTNCLICSQTICNSCELGYYALNGQCNPCVKPCETCSFSDTYCVTCVNSYYLAFNGFCSGCLQPCISCINQVTCLQCKSKEYKLTGNVCNLVPSVPVVQDTGGKVKAVYADTVSPMIPLQFVVLLSMFFVYLALTAFGMEICNCYRLRQPGVVLESDNTLDLNCSICGMAITINYQSNYCLHNFHTDCLQEPYRSNRKCPLCTRQ